MVGGNIVRDLWVEIVTLFLRLNFILRLPFSPDPLGSGWPALFRLILREDNNVAESLVKLLLELREVLPRERN